MVKKFIRLKIWLRERTLTEKLIIHIGLFPLPAFFLLLTLVLHTDSEISKTD
tara:strand:- start:346 stop:501 length:156 start_codon:yes stop_codon:yes gene_type:complete